jgi:hypothetical protein
MNRKRWIAVFLSIIIALALLMPNSGNMQGNPIVLFLNRTAGIAVLSMLLFTVVFAIHRVALGRSVHRPSTRTIA